MSIPNSLVACGITVEQHDNRRAGRIAAAIEGLQALRFARHFKLEGEALDDILNFEQATRELCERNFSMLTITRSPIGMTGGYRVVIAVRDEHGWHKTGCAYLAVVI